MLTGSAEGGLAAGISLRRIIAGPFPPRGTFASAREFSAVIVFAVMEGF
jgi:hypothetical protein